jgi:3-oxoacyl-[acyl-carrier-protein] synthase III
VDVADSDELFEIVDNEKVLALSHLGPGTGFRNEAAIIKSTGVRQRRILRMGTTTLDVAVAVAKRLQFEIGFDWNECPAIGLCHTHTADNHAAELARDLCAALGIRRPQLTVINYGCTGYLKLLREAADVLDRCLGNAMVPLLTVETPQDWHDAADRAFCGIISAGATGSVLHQGPGHRLKQVAARTVPIPDAARDWSPLFWIEEGEYAEFSGGWKTRRVMRMNGEAVFVNGVELMLDAVQSALSELDTSGRRVLIAPHQPSGKMLRALFAVLKREFPHAVYLNNLERHANSISSTIPTVLAHLDEVLADQHEPPARPGDLIILPAAGICMTAKPTHLAQGWAVLEW